MSEIKQRLHFIGYYIMIQTSTDAVIKFDPVRICDIEKYMFEPRAILVNKYNPSEAYRILNVIIAKNIVLQCVSREYEITKSDWTNNVITHTFTFHRGGRFISRLRKGKLIHFSKINDVIYKISNSESALLVYQVYLNKAKKDETGPDYKTIKYFHLNKKKDLCGTTTLEAFRTLHICREALIDIDVINTMNKYIDKIYEYLHLLDEKIRDSNIFSLRDRNVNMLILSYV